MQTTSPTVLSEHLLFSAPGPAHDSNRSLSTHDYLQRAMNIFLDNELLAPEDDHLELIVRFALEAQQLFFTAALYDPEEAQLRRFFDEFVTFCALPVRVL
jgi:hypothetical protein